jgi:hypothetical protein
MKAGRFVKIPAIGYLIREENRLILKCEKMLLVIRYCGMDKCVTDGLIQASGAAGSRSYAGIASRFKSDDRAGEADLHPASIG